MLLMEKKNKIEAIIGGSVYVLQGHESQEYMQQVALYIDRTMGNVKKLDVQNRMSTAQIAMLTSINVADDLLKLKKQLEEQNLENNGFYDEFSKLEKENAALKDKIAELQIELTTLRSKAK